MTRDAQQDLACARDGTGLGVGVHACADDGGVADAPRMLVREPPSASSGRQVPILVASYTSNRAEFVFFGPAACGGRVEGRWRGRRRLCRGGREMWEGRDGGKMMRCINRWARWNAQAARRQGDLSGRVL